MNLRSSDSKPRRAAQPAPTRGEQVPSTSASSKAACRVVAQGRIDTPMGPMTAAVTAHGLAGLWFDRQTHHPGALDVSRDDRHEHVEATRRWLDAYWRGEATDNLALDPAGTTFQQQVWRALLTIPLGRTSTYGDIAAAIGRPAASRAVGAAIGRNPVGIVVPCHRVIGRDGTLTGYAGGLDRKQRLLRHERAQLPREPRPAGRSDQRRVSAQLDLPIAVSDRA